MLLWMLKQSPDIVGSAEQIGPALPPSPSSTHLRTARKGSVLATKAVETHGRGSVLATKAVEHAWERQWLGHEGSGNTWHRQCLGHEGSENTWERQCLTTGCRSGRRRSCTVPPSGTAAGAGGARRRPRRRRRRSGRSGPARRVAQHAGIGMALGWLHGGTCQKSGEVPVVMSL